MWTPLLTSEKRMIFDAWKKTICWYVLTPRHPYSQSSLHTIAHFFKPYFFVKRFSPLVYPPRPDGDPQTSIILYLICTTPRFFCHLPLRRNKYLVLPKQICDIEFQICFLKFGRHVGIFKLFKHYKIYILFDQCGDLSVFMTHRLLPSFLISTLLIIYIDFVGYQK